MTTQLEERPLIDRWFRLAEHQTTLATPLTFSIATGLSLGLICYTLMKVAAGELREGSWLIWMLTVLFILRYLYLAAA